MLLERAKSFIVSELLEHSDIRYNILGRLLDTYWAKPMTVTTPKFSEKFLAAMSEQGTYGLGVAADYLDEYCTDDQRSAKLATALRTFSNFHTADLTAEQQSEIKECSDEWGHLSEELHSLSGFSMSEPLGPWYTHLTVNIQARNVVDALELMSENPIRTLTIVGPRINEENFRLIVNNYRMDNIVKLNIHCPLKDSYWNWLRQAKLTNLREMVMNYKNKMCIAAFLGNRTLQKGAKLSITSHLEIYTK